MTEGLSLGVLGPLRVCVDGRELSIPSAKQRALLAALLLARGRVMSVPTLVDALWGPAPPASADHLVQVYVSQLRGHLRKLGAAERLVTEAPGYSFTVREGELDAGRFEALASTANAPASALAEALELWRGDILSDVALEGDVAAEVRRLEELCLSVRERRLEAELDAGGCTRVIAELEPLVAAHPYRERLAWLLMLAQYRAGRQADALSVYRGTRDRLVEELGVEPGRALRDLEGAILRQDPALEHEPESELRSEDGSDRRRWYLFAAAVAVATVAVSVPLFGLGGGASPAAVHVKTGSVVVIEETPHSGHVLASRKVGDSPGALVKVGQVLAVADSEDRTLELINPKTLALERSVGLPDSPRSIAATGSTVWIAYAYRGRIGWYDLRSGFLSQEYRPTAHAQGLVALAPTPKRVWVSIRDGGLVGLSPTSLRVLSASGAGPFTSLAVAGRSLWGIGFFSGDVSRVGLARGNLKEKTPLTGEAEAITAGARAVWVTTGAPERLYRLDPRSGQVSWFVPLGTDPSAIAIGSRAVWVASGPMLLRIDPSRRELSSTINLGRPIASLTAGGNGRLFATIG